LKKLLLALAVLAVLIPIAVAQAAPVQEFSFQLKDVKKNGRFTVVFTSRSYDTTGGQPPDLIENFIRLPKAGVMAPQVRNKKYYCSADQLIKDLQANPVQGKTFASRVNNLTPFISKLKKSKLASDKKALSNAENCKRSRLGQGTVQVDARPLLNDLIPAVFFMFFGKGTVPGALGSLQIVGMPDENSSIVKGLPTTVQQTRVPAVANFVNDPTPDGKYGYKIVLPTGPIAGINVSFAELTAVTKGFSAVKKKKTCAKKRKGRCVKKKTKKTSVFWFKRPVCPASGKLNFQAFYGYNDPVPDTTKEIELPCPNFK
jgi:hypothetical protein